MDFLKKPWINSGQVPLNSEVKKDKGLESRCQPKRIADKADKIEPWEPWNVGSNGVEEFEFEEETIIFQSTYRPITNTPENAMSIFTSSPTQIRTIQSIRSSHADHDDNNDDDDIGNVLGYYSR
ncbi:hypothetical protein BHYA_0110g00270 [Botrytis hyacinthi]|uniref:Uncharacterized protein n=1 Tax=Botrytis hyacinthi TaxID=278943 RepID=A0A4Z1GJ34_9HELO|nr:hypothetical protein BHYA_0110g00270 [Botrytis hyacinthi]